MKNSNLIKLLKKLSKSEKRRFKEFVESPYFNKNEKVKALNQIILQFSPDFEDTSLSKQSVFSILFKDQVYDRLPINNVISDLFQLLLDFLIIEKERQFPIKRINHQIEVLQKKEQNKVANQRARRLEQILQGPSQRNHEVLLEVSKLHENLDQLFLNQQKRGYDANLQLQSDHFDKYYWVSKLKMACDMKSRNTILGSNYECHFLEEIKSNYQNNVLNIQAEPAAQIYFQLLLLLDSKEETAPYFELKELIQKYNTCFPKEELAGIYSYVINYCIKQINFGKREFDHEILELYKVLLKEELIFKNGFITQWTFRNIVTIGLRTRDFQWIQEFIENYQKYLLPSVRNNEVKFNQASLFFAEKKYSEALGSLVQVIFTDNFHQIGAKTIQLKSYFELEETESFLSLISAFSKYLRRHRQLSDYHKNMNLNFVRQSKKIYLWKTAFERMTRSLFIKKGNSLKKELMEIDLIANKDWLREAIERNLKGKTIN